MWALSSPTRDQTHTPALEGRLLTTGPLGGPYTLLSPSTPWWEEPWSNHIEVPSANPTCPRVLVKQSNICRVPGASTQDPTHDKVVSRRPDKQGRSGLQGFRKAAPAPTLKMISVFLMLAVLDYSLISVTQVEDFPDLSPNRINLEL